jgi:hypothetical protein
MKNRLPHCIALILLLLSSWVYAAERVKLPVDAAEALRSTAQVEIYSLEPLSRPDETVEALYGYEVLGKATLPPEASRVALAEFEAAVPRWDGLVAYCFDPRHALRVVHNGETFDFVLCFDCNGLEVYKNGKYLVKVGIAGSPKVLNELMEGVGLALSQTGYKPPTPEALAREAADLARWEAGMPASAHTLWERTKRFRSGGGLRPPEMAELRGALEADFPDPAARIRGLLLWFGSGKGPWTGFPAWESVPEDLLLEFSTEELILAVDWEQMDTAQREGAARLFAGWDFKTRRADDRHLLPLELKRALLDHTLTTGDGDQTDRRERAQRAFE